MSRRSLSWLIVASFVLPLGTLGQAQEQDPALPNIVLVIADCLRTDRINASRNAVELLPYVNDTAANGVWFRNAVSASSWTSTAVTSIFTSLDVDVHQVYQNRDTVAAGLETMAEYLKANGYHTVGVQMNANPLPQLGYGQGFDSYDHIPGVLAEVATSQAIQRIAGVAQPFFLYIHYVATHVPFRSPTSHKTLMGYPPPGLASSEKTIIENYLYEYYYDHLDYKLGIDLNRTYPPLSATGQEAVRMLFDAAARYTDDQVTQLMAAVNARSTNSFLIFTADHGEHFWEHDWLGHTMTLYEEVERVPLIVAGPGLTPALSDANVSTLDILPTLAALSALPVRTAWQGQDLFAPRDPEGPTFAYTQGQHAPYYVNLEMARWGSWKLVFDRNVGVPLLFDIDADPQENTDLAAQNPGMVQQLKSMLDVRRLVDGRRRAAEGGVLTWPNAFIEQGTTLRLIAPAGQEYQWMKDGAYLIEDWPHVTDVETQSLSISPTAPADLGRYECVYRDTSRRLRITQPYQLELLPPNSVPATSKPGLALLAFFLIAGAAIYTHRPGERSRVPHARGKREPRG